MKTVLVKLNSGRVAEFWASNVRVGQWLSGGWTSTGDDAKYAEGFVEEIIKA